MVAENAIKQDNNLTFLRLTRETAADPRTFSRLAEAVAAESTLSTSKIQALDANRMMEILDAVCYDLTRRHLHQANQMEDSPLENFRRIMDKGEVMVQAVKLAMGNIDHQWVRVEKEFGDKAPIIPERPRFLSAGRQANERLLKTAEGYLDKLIIIINDMLVGKTKSLEAQRKLETIKNGCLMLTGEELGDVADRWTDPIRRFRGPLETPGTELTALRRAYYALTGPTFEEKTRWDAILETTKELQWEARHDPAKFMAYVFRDADPSKAGQVLELEWFHVSWFGVWLDPVKPNSLIMAPPGHGKSFCVCAMDIWDAARMPELRFLVLYDKGNEKVAKEIMRIEGIMQSDLFRAVFPEIRILDRSGTEMVEGSSGKKTRKKTRRHAQTQYAFTIGRLNDLFSREATFEGAGVLSNINGDGFDRIRGDDFSPPQCREEPWQRQRYANRFTNVVEERLRDAQESRIRVIHTPWHPEDAPGRIRKAVQQGKLPTWRSQVEPYAIKDDASGKAIPLWAAKKNSAALEERKFRLGMDYDCCYRLQAADHGRRALSKVLWYNSLPKGATPADEALWDSLAEVHRTLSMDPAASDERTASDTGAIDGRITLDGYGFVPNVWLLHLQPTQLLEWIVEQIMYAFQVEKQPYDVLLIESQGAIKGMVNLFEEWLPKEFDKVGLPAAVWPSILTPGTRVGQGERGQNRGKMKRLRACAPYIERGSVRLAGRRNDFGLEPIPGSPMAVLAGLLKEFDGSTRFDGGDAFTQWILTNQYKLQDPFAKKEPVARTAKPQGGPMASAMAGVLSALTHPPHEESSLGSDTNRMFDKYGTAKKGNWR